MALPQKPLEHEEPVDDGVVWLSDEEARAYFDKEVREILGMSGEEFLRRLDSGEWYEVIDDGEHRDHLYLASLSSLAR